MAVTHATAAVAVDDGVSELGSEEWNAGHLGNSDFSLLVAANDASAKSKAAADYVCDGTADHVQIQAAIDALPSGAAIAGLPPDASGGTVLLSEGTFNITTVITSRGQLTLRGAGRQSTTILATGCSGIEYAPATGWNQSDWWQNFEDFTIRGDYTADKDGIHFDTGSAAAAHYSSINRLRIDRFDRYGLHLENGVYGFVARDSQVNDCDSDGFYIGAGCNATRLDNSRSTDNNGAGVRILGSGGDRVYQVTVANCVIEGNRDGGVLADWANGVSITGGYIEANARGNTVCFDGEAHGRTSPGHPVVGRNIWLATQANSSVYGSLITGNVLAGPIGSATGGTGYQIQLGFWDTGWALGVEVAGNEFNGIVTKHVLNVLSTGVIISASNRNDHDSEVGRQDVTGSSTLNGTTGRAITHNMNSSNAQYVVLVTPTASVAGRIYITKAADAFTVYSTEGADGGAFDWLIVSQGSTA